MTLRITLLGLFFYEDFWKIIFLYGEIVEFLLFFFCLKILFNVNGKATVWHTPCFRIMSSSSDLQETQCLNLAQLLTFCFSSKYDDFCVFYSIKEPLYSIWTGFLFFYFTFFSQRVKIFHKKMLLGGFFLNKNSKFGDFFWKRGKN
jgi:hypothetical protein